MKKAVFLDYTGTVMQQKGPDVQTLILRCFQHSNSESPKAALKYWWSKVKFFEANSYGPNFLTEDQIIDEVLKCFQKDLQLEENFTELHTLCQKFWVNAPIFEDVAPFFEACPVPIYMITNNGVQYVSKFMKLHQLCPEDIISGEMVKAYKPHHELFDKALEVSECSKTEVVHIGDSLTSDVKGAQDAGIMPILLDRSGQTKSSEYPVISSLVDAAPLLSK